MIAFSVELEALKLGHKIPKCSSLVKLSPFVWVLVGSRSATVLPFVLGGKASHNSAQVSFDHVADLVAAFSNGASWNVSINFIPEKSVLDFRNPPFGQTYQERVCTLQTL